MRIDIRNFFGRPMPALVIEQELFRVDQRPKDVLERLLLILYLLQMFHGYLQVLCLWFTGVERQIELANFLFATFLFVARKSSRAALLGGELPLNLARVEQVQALSQARLL